MDGKDNFTKAQKALRNRLRKAHLRYGAINPDPVKIDFLGEDENEFHFAVSFHDGSFNFYNVKVYSNSCRIKVA